tara:strand:+ start:114 stop:1448 length:1335 start_codon:yes stop_codon:yes gene_type:complete
MAEWFEDFTYKRQGSLINDYSGAIKFGLKKIDDAVDFVTDKGKELLQPVDEFFGFTEGKVVNGRQMPSGQETIQGLAEASYDVPYNAAKSLGAPEGLAVAAGVTGALLEPSPLGEAKAGTVAGELFSKTTKVVNKTPKGPPAGLQPAFATLKVQNGTVFYDGQKAAQDNLGRLLNQPLKIASDLTRQGKWQAPVRELRKGDNTRQLAAFFRKGPGGKLKTNNLYVTADELAANKDGVLDKMLERADKVDKAWDRYQARGSTAAQRNLYDIASKNIFESGAMIYGKDKARDFLAQTTNWLRQDEWHHIFGNKEAGEFVLMQAAQDPLVAVNIFAKMHQLKLHSSGIAKNIALMKKGEHLDWHKFMKAEGFEPRVAGKTTAPGDFADLSAALGREIASGNADVNDIFRMLELYSSFNAWVRKRTPGQNISDMEEGVRKALQIGGYK